MVGTRLYVYQVISTVRASEDDAEEAATYLGIDRRLVEAAVRYHAEFRDEVDADAEVAARLEGEARAAWKQQR